MPSQPHGFEAPERSKAQRRASYALLYVVGVLIILAFVPIVIASRAQTHRRLIADVIEPARIAAGELEAYSMERLLADSAAALRASVATSSGRPGRDARAVALQWATLDSAGAELGPDASRRIADLERTMRDDAGGAGHTSFSAAAALRTVAGANELQQWLDARVLRERRSAVAIERWNVWLPVILVPLALLGLFAILVAGREIAALGRTAQESAMALAAATEAKAALLRGVTHDLKNPLGAAQGFTELLAAGILGELTDGSREAVNRVQHLVGDAIKIVADLTELARAESGSLALASEPVALGDVVAECLRDHQAVAEKHHVTLRPAQAVAGVTPFVIQTDPRRVRQILDNLMSNAIKYTPEGGAVSVTFGSGPANKEVHVTVSDTGPGIPQQMRASIFDEFVRLRGHDLDVRRNAAHGTGVGLAISRRLARLLGGDLTVASSSEGGASFTLALPISSIRGTAVRQDGTSPNALIE